MAQNFFRVRNGITIGSLASNPSSPVNGDVYYNSSLNEFLFYQNGTWTPISGSTTPTPNLLYNGGFDVWKRVSPTGTGGNYAIEPPGTTPTVYYLIDRWQFGFAYTGTYPNTFRLLQNPGQVPGSVYGFGVETISATLSSMYIEQTLDNIESIKLYNQTASASIWVQALGNVNQIQVQFYYATSETQATTAIGSPVTYTVNTASFTQCTINGQAIGTAMTTSGVVGFRMTVTGVSSGNIGDIGNGFVVEQAMVNLGSSPNSTFVRKGSCYTNELALCQRFFETNYPDGQFGYVSAGPGVANSYITNTLTSVTLGGSFNSFGSPSSINDFTSNPQYKTLKRDSTTQIVYTTPNTGSFSINSAWDNTAAATITALNTTDLAAGSFRIFKSGGVTSNHFYSFMWTADYEIY